MGIVAIYASVPNFPAIDQHPDAVRYMVAGYTVDAIGGEPTEAEVLALLAPLPKLVTMRQARLALLAAGLLDDVNAALAAAPGTEGAAARIEWEYSNIIDRDSPLVAAFAAALALTEAQLDALFAQAATL